ncbi:MAG: hypothetical protein IK036_04135, partial [Clostridia bacterium]|nr:hypothetical protein [Clostridia bacterium]
LSLWEKAFISCIYGILDKTRKRQFREIALFVGRKCGKTLLASAIMTYEAYVDGEFGSEIYCVAPKLDQADLVYSAFEFTKDKNPDLAKRTRKRKSDYIIDATNTTIKKIAFNEKKADGYSPMLTVADEMSSWPAERGLKQWEAMTSGTGARSEPITLAISSGGYVNDGIYDELFKRGTRFLKGEGADKHLLPLFYTIDDIDKWDDVNELRKSLPQLGESISVQFILDEIDVARESLSKKTEFLCKYCNVKQNSSQAWLDTMYDGEANKEATKNYIAALESCNGPLAKEILAKKQYLQKKSIWIFGGDGWAYDIGFGGLDHVLASGEDVNVFVFDTEVYSNTGGQASKASQIGQVAQFAAAGKAIAKKSLAEIAMSYGYVYVAQVAMGADQNQTLKAIAEAEAYHGPSLIIGYSPCEMHSIKGGMVNCQAEMKKAVDCGYWNMFRYNPALKAEGKNPFTLDSKVPETEGYRTFLMNEARYSALTRSFPERAEALFTEAEENAKARYAHLQKLIKLYGEEE